ncbi:LuxR family transcriptional regulator [Aequorivita sp. H23M31]|uniref:LuxR family transcriptional regulator n=2 Tax=Aequorivita ciconiae TaxID=2494375 RepID=A0A410G7J4_9FLAO|nr:LuxR family transcriptional regulator [Aequorivita sp. H23M31]
MGISRYLENEDFSQQYNFFQRVKLHGETDYKWFYSVCKMFSVPENSVTAQKLVVLSNPLEGVGVTISKVNQLLDENIYIKNNYRVFATLTKSEKRIIALLVHGKSSRDIAEELSLSIHTVSTHRKNIIRKTQCTTFAALLKFAMAFEVY